MVAITNRSKKRQPINSYQQQILEEWLDKNAYPSTKEKKQIAALAGLTLKKVINWFTNTRYKRSLNKLYYPSHKCIRRHGTGIRKKLTDIQSNILNKWAHDNYDVPYPTNIEKKQLSVKTDLNQRKIENWFANWRRRVWRNNCNVSINANTVKEPIPEILSKSSTAIAIIDKSMNSCLYRTQLSNFC